MSGLVIVSLSERCTHNGWERLGTVASVSYIPSFKNEAR